MARHTPSAALPTIICIDIEPDDRAPDPERQPEWGGFEALAHQIRTLRSDIADATRSPAHFSWFLRMDPQIAVLHGSAGWAATHYRTLLDEFRAAGDEIGIHLHSWRWLPETRSWSADFADVTWGRHVVRTGLQAFRDSFGRPCRTVRYGDRWLSGAILREASSLGVRFDLTPEPGVKSEPPGESHHGLMPDYTPTPIWPFRPSQEDPAMPARRGTRRGPWMIPMTTVEHGPALQRAVERLAANPRAATGGPYTGWIDRVTTEWIGGWAYDAAAPDRALTVVVYDGKTPIGAVLADEPRADLEVAGFGDGRHGFTLDFGSRLNPRPDHTMSATILGTGEWLQGGPVDLRCEPRLSQTHRTLDLGQAFVGPVLDDVLDDPHGRRHIALPMRSNSAGPTVSQAFRHLMTHQRASSLRLSTPQEAIAALRVQLRARAPSR